MASRTRVHRDPQGFPMIWCDAIAGYVHWLPVTKVQFEYFLCDAPDTAFDATWYRRLLALNPRVTPHRISATNYWGSLMTGLRPVEAERYASWCGDDYRLPREEEWRLAYRAFRGEPVADLTAWGLADSEDHRMGELLGRIDAASREAAKRMGGTPNQAAQMLFSLGAMEWVGVGSPPSSWGALGEPLPEFCGNLEVPGESSLPFTVDPSACRLPSAGFRLLYFPAPDETDTPGDGEPTDLLSQGGAN